LVRDELRKGTDVPNVYGDSADVERQFAAMRSRFAELVREERMDVLAATAKGDNEERAARTRHIEDVARDLRAEFRREVMELREEVGELLAEVHNMIGAERVAAQDSLDGLRRAFDARTGHLT
jgi:F0F1-type ATP synthase membrane subunit b/b'